MATAEVKKSKIKKGPDGAKRAEKGSLPNDKIKAEKTKKTEAAEQPKADKKKAAKVETPATDPKPAKKAKKVDAVEVEVKKADKKKADEQPAKKKAKVAVSEPDVVAPKKAKKKTEAAPEVATKKAGKKKAKKGKKTEALIEEPKKAKKASKPVKPEKSTKKTARPEKAKQKPKKPAKSPKVTNKPGEVSLDTKNKVHVPCPDCGERLHRKGERAFRHVNQEVVRYYCPANCKRYYMFDKVTGKQVVKPEGWTRGDSLRGRTGRTGKRALEIQGYKDRISELETALENAGGVPTEEAMAKKLGIDIESLEYPINEKTQRPRIVVNAITEDEVSKLSEEDSAVVFELQGKILVAFAVLSKIKAKLKSKE